MALDSIRKWFEKLQNREGELLELTCSSEKKTTHHISISWEEYMNQNGMKNGFMGFLAKVAGRKTDAFGLENLIAQPFKCKTCGSTTLRWGNKS